MEEKLLSIIIPSYKETEDQVLPLLWSIANSLGIDLLSIEVIIVRDGTNELDLQRFKELNLNINQLVLKENKGPGIARQIGLDAAKGKYILFCDADDLIHNVGIIGAMTQEMDKQNWDILKTPWLEEQIHPLTKQQLYITHEKDNTWMHGKMFRRSFLKDNKISFHPDLRVHEDSYFLGVCSEYTEKVGYLNVTSYVWKWGDTSITRHDDCIYRYASAIDFIKACTYVHQRVEHLPLGIKHMQYKIVQFIIYHYFILHTSNWLEKKEYLGPTEEAFAENIKPFFSYWTESDKSYITKIYGEERAKHFANEMEEETLNEWLKRLGLTE